MIRIFVAFPISGKLSDDLMDISTRSPIKGIRWTKKDNLHITLFFIGEVEEKNITKIIQALETVFKNAQPFKLKFDSVLLKKNKQGPAMIWAQFEQNKLYAQLSQNIYKAVKSFMTIVPAHKDPVPHGTLARIKWHADVSPLDISFEHPRPIEVDVNSAELWKTVQSEDGVVYESISVFKMS